MTAHDPLLHHQPRSLLRWLGFTSAKLSAVDGRACVAEADDPTSARSAARRQLIQDIGDFLAAHDLDANAYALAIAHDFVTGNDPQIVRQIERRVQSRKPVTPEWLEQVSERPPRESEQEMLSALMVRLEQTIEEFGKTTHDAKNATSSYNTALEQHVGELEQVSKAGAVMTELATIARVMLDRTREIEQEMSRSELRTRFLRRNLEQARRSAERDHLTGLPNRRAFEALLETEYKAAQAAREPMCVAFCDIDNFKAINDVHGHDAGDRVLRVVAQNLARISKDRCHVARHGGEEFVVLLRGRTAADSWELLDEARSELAERRLVNRATDAPFGKITFSAGIADVFVHPDPRSALKAADQALYKAKEQGRNRVVVAPRP